MFCSAKVHKKIKIEKYLALKNVKPITLTKKANTYLGACSLFCVCVLRYYCHMHNGSVITLL